MQWQYLMSLTLGLDYNPAIDHNVLEAFERAVKRTGLALDKAELIGQDATAAVGYIAAFEDDDVDGYLDTIHWPHLEDKLNARPIEFA